MTTFFLLKYFPKEKTEKKKAPYPGGRGRLSKVFKEKILTADQ
jgi:hypothetical protein